jgi:hypothetical protein
MCWIPPSRQKKIQDPTLSYAAFASTTEVRDATILVLLICSYKPRKWGRLLKPFIQSLIKSVGRFKSFKVTTWYHKLDIPNKIKKKQATRHALLSDRVNKTSWEWWRKVVILSCAMEWHSKAYQCRQWAWLLRTASLNAWKDTGGTFCSHVFTGLSRKQQM